MLAGFEPVVSENKVQHRTLLNGASSVYLSFCVWLEFFSNEQIA